MATILLALSASISHGVRCDTADVVAAPSTTASCRMWRPSLDVDDAFAAQIATTSSPHNGLAPSKPQAASRHHKHPACAATAAGSTRLRYQLLAPPLATPLLLPLAASHSSLFSLLWVLISQEHTHTHMVGNSHAHTLNQGESWLCLVSGENHRRYMFSPSALLALTFFINSTQVYIYKELDTPTNPATTLGH